MAKKPTYSVRFVAGQPVERIEPSLPLGQIEEMLPIGMPLYTEGTLKIAVWNIYKQQRVNWRSMLETLATDTQLLLLQEAQTTPELVRFAGKNHLIADQVPALAFQQHPAGVMTLSSSHPIYCCPLREKEPFLRLAKSALITVYPLITGEHLMVINVHAINFSFGVDVYQRQLNSLSTHIIDHKGPVILAGDFNAWSRPRVNVLKRFARRLKLKEVIFEKDLRTRAFGKPLDYIFYRGLSLNKAEILITDASDHNPLVAIFS
ncbi:endonuclease/exonuclease/phosphatase family protein [Proteus mirabilis]|uniref:endonuclease/exonuclease/phosphatase family protein n=1 Tax=Proteus mirabilis TaxID=584 RepID=UPI001581B396|nr:endonuclease/exonuclease/phosphatase family protein [Proteus mirabilis]MBG2817364.1 endonuclease/exonuclease/phosphatase family protein [Proteus mirabilis]MBG2866297.1 endonuclease/exonuclease/phosphatase family protein [Proteus mirabilis]MBL1399868.1 endonuclease/exonuclease/phosphatase family protein [Proteus mirabilis]MCL8567364.1 endonuclease/exonuclease/phosphatase family protein [Proteus mirabilis]MCL8628533.1 endonuclease/exonuclease/phosphatase family protein [Proteus mirabilis]